MGDLIIDRKIMLKLVLVRICGLNSPHSGSREWDKWQMLMNAAMNLLFLKRLGALY
jgi:hypothetical protein